MTTDLAPSQRGLVWEPFQLMERLDDEAIMTELRGGTIDALVYSFEQDGRKVVGLSKEGVDASCRELAKQGEVIREIDIREDHKPEGVYVKVLAGRYALSSDGKEVLLDSGWGAKFQPRMMKINVQDKFGKPARDQNGMVKRIEVDDPFFYEKAVGKAARNARRRMIPENLIAMIIEGAGKAGRVRNVGPTARQQQTGPTARTTRQETPAKQEEPETTQTVTEAEETPPEEPQDMSPQEFSETAKALGFESKNDLYTALGVRNLRVWRRKATTATPLREAIEKLKAGRSAEESGDDDSGIDL